MGAIWGTGDEVLSDLDVPTGKSVVAGPEPGSGNGIGHEDAFLQTRRAKVVLQGEELHVNAVGDEAKPQSVPQ